jgi:hypothetical protein
MNFHLHACGPINNVKYDSHTLGFEPSDYTFTVTGNNPSPSQFSDNNVDGCVDVTIGHSIRNIWNNQRVKEYFLVIK